MVAVKGELNHLKVRRYDLYLLLLDIFSFPTSPFSSINILYLYNLREHWIQKKLSIWFWPFWNGIRKGLMQSFESKTIKFILNYSTFISFFFFFFSVYLFLFFSLFFYHCFCLFIYWIFTTFTSSFTFKQWCV